MQSVSLFVSHRLSVSTILGLYDRRVARQMESLVRDAEARGARLVTGGGRHPRLGGCYFLPTVLEGVTPDMDVFHNEIFGPVASIIK